jgi:hypothetical protein
LLRHTCDADIRKPPPNPSPISAGLLLDGKGAALRNQLITIDGPRISAITTATTQTPTYNLQNLTILPA